jgi:fructose-bisphosphate aldolase class 1
MHQDGTPFPDYLTKLGIIPGIKVDHSADQETQAA